MRVMREARRWSLSGVLVLAAIMACAPALAAQVVTGTVRDSASQQPLPNTRVVVVDPAGRATAQSTTDQQGRFRLSPWTGRGARAASLRLRVVRMGFRPAEVPLVRGAAGAPLEIAVSSFPVVLEEVQVMAATCPRRADRAAALNVLQQVRMALFATVLARSQSSGTMTRLLYERRLDGPGGRIVSQTVRRKVTSGSREPFSAARSAAAFDRRGFVRDAAGLPTYAGPDAETLIDDAFSQQYCVRMSLPDPARPGLVGLGFEPVFREEGKIDFVGTVWIDTLSRVLQDLTFRYVGLDRETSALRPEGRLTFRELPNGVVIIEKWSLRLAGDRARTEDGIPEIGGEVARATWPDGSSWRAPLGTMRLHVVDNGGRPATAASVQLVDTDYQMTMDATGMIVLDDLLPGPYTASVRDPRLVALGIPSNASLRFTAMRDSTKESLLQIETAEDVVRRRCSQDAPPSNRGWVLGRVVTPAGQPVRDARWSIRDQFGSALVEDGKVDESGLFQWCQLPLNQRVSVDVWRENRRMNDSRIVMDRLTTLHFVLQP